MKIQNYTNTNVMWRGERVEGKTSSQKHFTVAPLFKWPQMPWNFLTKIMNILVSFLPLSRLRIFNNISPKDYATSNKYKRNTSTRFPFYAFTQFPHTSYKRYNLVSCSRCVPDDLYKAECFCLISWEFCTLARLSLESE